MSNTKPPYQVMRMVEIEATPANRLTVASTFSGCGGSCLGFRMDGWTPVWANEFIPEAIVCYRDNHPGVPVDERSIRNVVGSDLLQATGLGVGDLDCLEGSPPCDSFSPAGSLSKQWGKEKAYHGKTQRTDDLFFEYIRLLGEVMPRTFVAENVSGMVRGVSKGMFKQVLLALRKVGYRVEARVLDAQWLGVPQRRRRVIFVGVREDFGVDPALPRPLPYRYVLRDAIPNAIAEVKRGHGYFPGSVKDAGAGAASTQCGSPTSEIILATPPAESGVATRWDRLTPGRQSKDRFNRVRAAWDQPSPTILGLDGILTMASAMHPTERRKFTIPELKRICGFPDDFKLTGTFAAQYARLGLSVPPVMMYHIANTLRTEVFSHIRKT